MCSYANLTLDSLIETAKDEFRNKYNQNPEVCSFAPGRINLIGDHTDYNDGYVLPMTIPKYTVIVGSTNKTNQSTVSTLLSNLNEPDEQIFTLDNIQKSADCKWINYMKGVIALFPFKEKLANFNALVISNVPIGQGLSSSASLEVATFEFLAGLLENEGIVIDTSKEDRARICQKAENDWWANMPCGIMDQLISFLGSEDCALLIDCRNLSTELISIDKLLEKGYCFFVVASNVQHELSNSEYPKRRKVCETVANLLSKSSLRDVSMKELETSINTLPLDYYQKCRHVITEIERTKSSAEALKNEEYLVFGTLMIQSHLSLKNDYNVTCPETDQIVDLAVEFGSLNNKNVYARQSGGGFGGAVIVLIQQSDVNDLSNFLLEKYTGNTKLDFYRFSPGQAAKHFITSLNNNC